MNLHEPENASATTDPQGRLEALVSPHFHGKPCPLTGEPIPRDTIWTDHERHGCFNACGACADVPNSIAESLEQIAQRRKLRAG